MITVVLGNQWGDEGKGKLIDSLTPKHEIVVRATGGANAGHTIKIQDPKNPEKIEKFVFHLIPSGILHEGTICVISNGLALHIPTLLQEIEALKNSGIDVKDRIFISDRAHMVLEYHKMIDEIEEEMKGKNKIGTTKRGIGPCYTDKVRRNGVRVGDLQNFENFKTKYLESLLTIKKLEINFPFDAEGEINQYKEILEIVKPMIIDTAFYLNQAIKNGKNILIEGANGAMLDIDHGSYPFVTSSNASIGGMITGTGIPPTKIGDIIGIIKAYTTRVGSGPFPTELLDEICDKIREKGDEYGATTGRPRRCGWFDAVVGKYTAMINGCTSLNLSKLDVLSGLPSLKIATAYILDGKPLPSFPSDLSLLEKIKVEYIEMPGWSEDLSKIRKFEDLPVNAQNYVKKIEELVECRISSIGVGAERSDLIFR